MAIDVCLLPYHFRKFCVTILCNYYLNSISFIDKRLMNIIDIIKRPMLTAEENIGEKIPWDDHEFSQRMLANHLSQDHDWASRRKDLITRHVAWLTSNLKPGSRILDLACGPGFYTQALAVQGHKCTGVDFSPASIAYGRRKADESGLDINYVLEDIRKYSAEGLFDCVIFVFGEFNVFSEADARLILANCGRMLTPGGLLLVEGHTFEAVRETGEAAASWWTCGPGGGVLSARSHLCLQENVWDDESAVAMTRYYTVDAETCEVRVFTSSMTAYSFSAYESLLSEAGFDRLTALSPEQWPAGGPFEGLMTTIVGFKA